MNWTRRVFVLFVWWCLKTFSFEAVLSLMAWRTNASFMFKIMMDDLWETEVKFTGFSWSSSRVLRVQNAVCSGITSRNITFYFAQTITVWLLVPELCLCLCANKQMTQHDHWNCCESPLPRDYRAVQRWSFSARPCARKAGNFHPQPLSLLSNRCFSLWFSLFYSPTDLLPFSVTFTTYLHTCTPHKRILQPTFIHLLLHYLLCSQFLFLLKHLFVTS